VTAASTTNVAGAARIRAAFEHAAAESRAAFVPYLVAGRPTRDSFVDLLRQVDESGADVIEIGVPFSDPLADGAVIRDATRGALDEGMTVAGVLELVRTARARGVVTPIILMGYANPLLSYGLDAFCRDAAAAGVDGLIAADAAELIELDDAARASGLGMTMLVTPLSSDERIAELAGRSTGFLYAVASTGTTGARTDVADATIELLERARALAGGVPVAVGFGISTPQHVARLAPHADGVIVGSALVDLVERDPAAAPSRVAELRAATLRTP
jgi:tryptophan synthase alpha chain